MANLTPGYTTTESTELNAARAARKARIAARQANRQANPEAALAAKHFTPPIVKNRECYDYITEPTATAVISIEEQQIRTARASQKVNHIRMDETLVDVARSHGGRMLIRQDFSRAQVKPDIVTPITKKGLPLKIELDAKFKISYDKSKGSTKTLQYVDVYVTYTGAKYMG